MTLPGERSFTDEEIASVMADALAVFGLVVEQCDPPADLRVTILQSIMPMVGQRQMPAVLAAAPDVIRRPGTLQ